MYNLASNGGVSLPVTGSYAGGRKKKQKELKAKNTFFFDSKKYYIDFFYNSSNAVQDECKCKFYFAEIQMLKNQSQSSVL